jgi:hypothetical protein
MNIHRFGLSGDDPTKDLFVMAKQFEEIVKTKKISKKSNLNNKKLTGCNLIP